MIDQKIDLSRGQSRGPEAHRAPGQSPLAVGRCGQSPRGQFGQKRERQWLFAK